MADQASLKIEWARRVHKVGEGVDMPGVELNVTVENTGDETWTSGNKHYLQARILTPSGYTVGPYVERQSFPGTMAPGATSTRTVSLYGYPRTPKESMDLADVWHPDSLVIVDVNYLGAEPGGTYIGDPIDSIYLRDCYGEA